VQLPPGYYVTWGGQFENLASAKQIRKKQTGTTTISRCLAEARFSNCPPQVT
jgi:hypothetical protein